MKFSLFIAICFLIITVLNIVPQTQNLDDGGVFYYGNILPGLLPFTSFCILALSISLAIVLYKSKQKLPGQVMVTRKDLKLRPLMAGIILGLALTVFSQLVAKQFHFFVGTGPYFLILTICVLLFHLLRRRIIQVTQPSFMSIDKSAGLLYARPFLFARKSNLKSLEAIRCNLAQRSLTVQFEEGTDNVKLYLTDFDTVGIQSMVALLRQTGPQPLHVDDSIEKLIGPGLAS
jgi:hypothetical protein